MKMLLVAVLATGLIPLATGCATPGYSGGPPTIKFPQEKATGENANRVVRAWYYDSREIIDDINSSLMLDQPSHLTPWNIR